jgi:ABC-2 type transport system permease protein
MTRLAEYVGQRELVVNLTLRELRGRYKRSVLGWTWSMLNPLASVLIYTVVFSYILTIKAPPGRPSRLHEFALFLVCGLIPWTLFSSGITGTLGALVANGNLIKKVYFPRQLLVLSTVASLVITSLIEFGVLMVVLLAFGNMVIPWIPMLLVLLVLQSCFILGVGLAMSVWNVYFRDLQHLMGIVIQILFYMTPIVYPIGLVPDEANVAGMTIPFGDLYRLNPMVEFVGAYRNVLYDLRFPSWGTMAALAAWSVGALIFGAFVFSRLDHRLAEEV